MQRKVALRSEGWITEPMYICPSLPQGSLLMSILFNLELSTLLKTTAPHYPIAMENARLGYAHVLVANFIYICGHLPCLNATGSKSCR